VVLTLPFPQLAFVSSVGLTLLIPERRAVDLGIKTRKGLKYSIGSMRKNFYQNEDSDQNFFSAHFLLLCSLPRSPLCWSSGS
jgi:hypothetical protein